MTFQNRRSRIFCCQRQPFLMYKQNKPLSRAHLRERGYLTQYKIMHNKKRRTNRQITADKTIAINTKAQLYDPSDFVRRLVVRGDPSSPLSWAQASQPDYARLEIKRYIQLYIFQNQGLFLVLKYARLRMCTFLHFGHLTLK